MERLAPLIANTPLWVWPLLLVLLWLGFQASRPRTVGLWRITILPAALFAMSVSNLVSMASSVQTVFAWLSGLALGVLCGLRFGYAAGLRIDREHRLLAFPGEWRSLILILAIFVLRYYHGYKSATDPAFVAQPDFATGYLALTSFLASLFIGWRLHSLQTYRTAPSENLFKPVS